LSKKIKSLYANRDAIQKGKKYGIIDSDTERWGFEILAGPKDILTIEAVSKAEAHMIEELKGK
jgi:hypothetical protein